MIPRTKETSLDGLSLFLGENLVRIEMGSNMEQTIYYISEAAQKVQVESHVLRYWEDELKLPIHRNEMGHRCYTEQNIEQLKEIKTLKEQGLQLKAIKAILGKGENTILDKAQKYIVSLSKDPDPEKTVIYPVEETKEESAVDATRQAGQAAVLQERVKSMKERAEAEVCALPQSVENKVASTCEKEIVREEGVNEKAARLQLLLQHMITDAVKSANRELCTDVKDSILKELDYQFRMQEERDDERWKKEEEHYRKIDEMIRERHAFKEKPKKEKKKSPISF